MQAIVRACAAERWPAQVVCVVSNRPDAGGLAWASQQGLATQVVDHRAYGSGEPARAAFDAALMQAIDRSEPDLLVLAGFMRILTPGFTRHYAGRLLNIHPSLLPSFPGLHTHERALEAGVRWHGATVHFVTAELDHGPIVAQAAIPVHDDDTPQTLAERLLVQEHLLYPMAVRWFIEGRLRIEGLRVHVQPPQAQALCAPA